MSTGARKNPFKNSKFILEIDGIIHSGLTEVVISSNSIEIIESMEGNENPTSVRKLPGLTKYSNIILKREITDSLELYNWYKDIEDGKISTSRKNISIILHDKLGKEQARWDFVQAWPVKYSGPCLNAIGNEIAIETLEIAHEGMIRAK